MNRFLIAVPLAAGLAVGAAGVSGAFSSGSATPEPAQRPMQMHMATAAGAMSVQLHKRVVHVKIENFKFSPARVTVSPGTKVVWTNKDSDPHTATTDKRGFGSPALDTGKSYTHVLSKVGTYAYHCQIHPQMHGTVIVKR
jgi:plastocyanin